MSATNDTDRAEIQRFLQRAAEIGARLDDGTPMTTEILEDARALKAEVRALEERLKARGAALVDEIESLRGDDA